MGERLLNWIKAHKVMVAVFCTGLLLPIAALKGSNSFQGLVSPMVDEFKTSMEANPIEGSKWGKVPSVKVRRRGTFWKLTTKEENEAKLVVFPDDQDIRRVEITRADTDVVWHISLRQMPFRVQAKEWYSLRFRARADGLRNMGVNVSQAHAPWKVLGLYRKVAVMRQWQDYQWEFLMPADDDNAKINFQLGGWNVPVEIGKVRLLKLSHENSKWRLNLRDGSEAGLMGIPELPLGIRVAITKSLNNTPKHIQLVQQGVKLQVNERYRIRLNARADKPRDMYLAVSQAQYPWESLGLNQKVSLTSEWQLFDLEFVAKSTDENARLIFKLGGHNISVDFNAVLVQRNSEVVIHNGDSSAPSLGEAPVVLNAVKPS